MTPFNVIVSVAVLGMGLVGNWILPSGSVSYPFPVSANSSGLNSLDQNITVVSSDANDDERRAKDQRIPLIVQANLTGHSLLIPETDTQPAIRVVISDEQLPKIAWLITSMLFLTVILAGSGILLVYGIFRASPHIFNAICALIVGIFTLIRKVFNAVNMVYQFIFTLALLALIFYAIKLSAQLPVAFTHISNLLDPSTRFTALFKFVQAMQMSS